MSHIHRVQPYWTTARITRALAAARASGDGRCCAVPGDQVDIEARCRCGASRLTPAVMVSVDGHVRATATGKPGAWVGGQS